MEGLPPLLSSTAETLRVYLSQNMNVTRTAAELFIHRSTLLERLSRIARELGEDLEDPDVRLRLQILLKALEMQDTVQKSLFSPLSEYPPVN